MNAMGERFALERTVTRGNGRTVLWERRYCGVLDVDGTFRLRAFCEKRLSFRQDSDEKLKNKSRAA